METCLSFQGSGGGAPLELPHSHGQKRDLLSRVFLSRQVLLPEVRMAPQSSPRVSLHPWCWSGQGFAAGTGISAVLLERKRIQTPAWTARGAVGEGPSI